MLVASMNPCPCGYYNHPEKECICPPGTVQKYLSKISGPLLDRIDLHVEVTPVNFNELASDRAAEKSESIRERVIKAREIQIARFGARPDLHANAQMSPQMVREVCKINTAGQTLPAAKTFYWNIWPRRYILGVWIERDGLGRLASGDFLHK
jgi:magnesium chelatase family protein